MERSADDLGVTFEYSDGRTATKKTFQFMPKSYLVQITSQVVDNGVLLPHELTWRGGFGDQTIANPASVEDTLYYDEANSKLVQERRESGGQRSGHHQRPVFLRGHRRQIFRGRGSSRRAAAGWN